MENSEYVYLYFDTRPTKLLFFWGGGHLLQEFMFPAFNITCDLHVEDSYVLTNSTDKQYSTHNEENIKTSSIYDSTYA
jgi:hypothetical protein